ncbi:hydroxymethylbilane synthase [Allopusillimonas soli]|uniref:Porphobilinogen deaminase n=1 Tax=Allopusillimonas soli TaxID=659016 RepID=A0A853FAX6_9BURK|nr:hydroxymethylbilane synthase [Allopusillimonas soli]NYT36928.1 hydroxymethylbilane synthase [Allopusillimonas soli]TEA75382.1 hydroxymethylbilane synthase [Allopusillimonas soli]
MTEVPKRLVIATRASRLALWQAEHVRDALRAHYPSCDISLLTLTTRGDQILDRSLSKVGGKGLFVKELENALLDGRADLAVHSLKDVPMELAPSFALPVILKRDDPRDAFVSNDYGSLHDLPDGAVVGTSSLRREAQIRARHPSLVVKPLRGNLDTRLGKLDRGDYAAIILAAAGLRRLGLQDRIRAYLSPDESLPAAGQGALGIEILASRGDLARQLAVLADPAATACAHAERAVSRVLGGSCQVPLAAYAELEGGIVSIRARVAEPDGSRMLHAQASGEAERAQAVGEQAAQSLLEQGAGAILTRLVDVSDMSSDTAPGARSAF